MCLECACGELNENYGDPRHLTLDSIRDAAQASEIGENEAMQNIQNALQQVGKVGTKTAYNRPM